VNSGFSIPASERIQMQTKVGLATFQMTNGCTCCGGVRVEHAGRKLAVTIWEAADNFEKHWRHSKR